MNNNISIKNISDLLKEDYFIPSYQRGYRWTQVEVVQLLEDIWNFSKRDDRVRGEFYCLQPIVVKKINGEFEIIDGQQRFTTIFLIVKHLEDIIKLTFPHLNFKAPFYETRSDSRDFLNDVKHKSEAEAKLNIDFYHIWSAFHAIKNWFGNSESNVNVIDFLNTLLKSNHEDGNDPANNVRVIWYEISEAENSHSIEIFTRLNIGKIALTNSELIKALFLQKSNFLEEQATIKQIQIASEWDIIEKALQNDTFWYFIYNPDQSDTYDNRIEYIFDLMKNKTKDNEKHFTFNEFFKDFQLRKKENKNIETIWLDIKRFFLSFEEWFNNRTLFHYIGFLVSCKHSINQIKSEGEKKSKDKFEAHLKEQIRKHVNLKIEDLEYKDGDKVRRVLLLFNIQTILSTQKSDMRFPFHRYKTEQWDIEHISSQTTKRITEQKRLLWINDILDYFNGSNTIDMETAGTWGNAEINSICQNLFKLKSKERIDDEAFGSVFNRVQKFFHEEQMEEKHDLSNLALLDATTNRSYGNSFFPIKRKRIIENDKNGVFVPIATKNLFLKYYSKRLSEIMYWTESDANDYLESIKYSLAEFLPAEKEPNEQ